MPTPTFFASGKIAKITDADNAINKCERSLEIYRKNLVAFRHALSLKRDRVNAIETQLTRKTVGLSDLELSNLTKELRKLNHSIKKDEEKLQSEKPDEFIAGVEADIRNLRASMVVPPSAPPLK